MGRIEDIEGIGPAYAEKLKEQDVKTTEAQLEAAASVKGCQQLAAATGINEKSILAWANRADLFRVKGVGTRSRIFLKPPELTPSLIWPNAGRTI